MIDHCVFRLSTEDSPKLIVLVEYENKGFEPRVATLRSFVSGSRDSREQLACTGKSVIQLCGSRRGDVDQLVLRVLDVFAKEDAAHLRE